MAAKVYIVVLNWNNAPDTIECLESLFRLDYPDYRVVVCDNASDDDSVAVIEAWAAGDTQAVPRSTVAEIRDLTRPPVPKPVRVLGPAERDTPVAEPGPALTLIRVSRNGGYASGNNAGIRFALARGDAGFVWILNNDTVVAQGALTALVQRAQADPSVGICGSLLRFYDQPEKVQAAAGAVYHPATAIPANIAQGESPSRVPSRDAVEARLDFIVGASALVSRRFLEQVGLMSEDYFLYYEEIDWIQRAKGRFRLGFAPDSVVFHKEGASAGSDPDWRTRSAISDLCALRNRLLITRRYFRAWYPLVAATFLIAFARRIRRGQPRRALHILRMLAGPESYRLALPDGSTMTAVRGAPGERGIATEEEEKPER